MPGGISRLACRVDGDPGNINAIRLVDGERDGDERFDLVRLEDDASQNREYSQLGRECDIMISTFDRATVRALVTVPLKTDVTVDYGILAAKHPSPKVESFLSKIRRQLPLAQGERAMREQA